MGVALASVAVAALEFRGFRLLLSVQDGLNFSAWIAGTLAVTPYAVITYRWGPRPRGLLLLPPLVAGLVGLPLAWFLPTWRTGPARTDSVS